MTAERHVRLFRSGRGQAIRIPRAFELPGKEVIIRKEGASLIIEPATPISLVALLATLTPMDEDFPDIADPHPAPATVSAPRPPTARERRWWRRGGARRRGRFR